MSLLVIFIILTILNVILSTIKSIVTINSGKFTAALVSAFYYGYYNIVLLYTVADFPMWQKVATTFACNLVGVFVVKWGEEIARKDKLWKVEMTVKNDRCAELAEVLTDLHIPHNYIPNVGKWTIFNCYCATQKESQIVKSVANKYKVKYFVSESKTL